MKLNAEQKCDIATRELEELREEMEKMKEESDKILDNYKVSLFEKFKQCKIKHFPPIPSTCSLVHIERQ